MKNLEKEALSENVTLDYAITEETSKKKFKNENAMDKPPPKKSFKEISQLSQNTKTISDSKIVVEENNVDDKTKMDKRLSKVQKSLKSIGKMLNLPLLHQKVNKKSILYQYENGFSSNKYRCYDEIGHQSKLIFKEIMKDEHIEIATKFQTLSPHWKYVKIKSTLNTDHISAFGSLNANELNDEEIQQQKQLFTEKMENLCTSLFFVHSKKQQQISDNNDGDVDGEKKSTTKKKKEVFFEKIKGQDYLEEFIGNLNFKFGPFSYMPTNVTATDKMFKRLRGFKLVKKSDIIVDFDCNAGLYGLNLAKTSKTEKAQKVVVLENSPVLIKDFQINAKALDNIPTEIHQGCNLYNFGRVLQDFHYGNHQGVLILHPKGQQIIPLDMIEAIYNSKGIRRIILFTSDFNRQGFEILMTLLRPEEGTNSGSKKRYFHLNAVYNFDLHTKTTYMENVLVLDRNED